MEHVKPKLVEGPFGLFMSDHGAKALDAIVKSMPNAKRKLRTKAMDTETTEVDQESRTEVSIVTTDSMDLEGEIVIQSGLDTTKFTDVFGKKVYFNHDYTQDIGRGIWIKPKGNNAHIAKTKYNVNKGDPSVPFLPNQIWNYILSGLLQSKSIGFLATNERNPTSEELALHPQWAGGTCLDQTVLLEWSVCAQGQNPDCVLEMLTKGLPAHPELLAKMGVKVPPKKKKIDQNLLLKMVDDGFGKINFDELIRKALDYYNHNSETKPL